MYIYLHAICVFIASSFGCKIERSKDRFLDGFVLVAYIELPSFRGFKPELIVFLLGNPFLWNNT